MMSLVFHVGAQASGGWLAQQFLRREEARLRDRGVVPIATTALTDAVGPQGETLVDSPEPLRVLLASTAARAGPGNTIVASQDTLLGPSFGIGGLYPHAEPRLRALARILEKDRIRIVLAIRPQAAFLEGRYLESVNSGGTATWSQWSAALDLDDLSWRPVVDQLIRLFGAEAVHVLDTRCLEVGRDAYLAEFFRAAGLPEVGPGAGRVSAPIVKLSGKGVGLALAANTVLGPGSAQRKVRDFLLREFSDLDYPRPCLLNDEQQCLLSERYDAEYEALVSSSPTPSPSLGVRDDE